MFMTTKEKFFDTLRNAVVIVAMGLLILFSITMFFMMWARPEAGKALFVLFFIIFGIGYFIYEAYLRSLCHSHGNASKKSKAHNVPVKANASSLDHYLDIEVPNYTPAPATQPQFFDYEAHQ